MINVEERNMELRAKVNAALEGDNNDAIAEAMVMMANSIQQDIIKEARTQMNMEQNDRTVLAQRGQSVLTGEERSYYKKVVENRGFTNLDSTMPKTIFNRVFDDLVANHPILSKVDFINAEIVQEWLFRTNECVGAVWGKVDGEIVKELEAGFDVANTGMYKLTAFMPLSKDMLVLGADFLDKYVRTVLAESISIALESAIIIGTGKDMPIGMIKDLDGAVVSGVYPDKVAVAITKLDAATLGEKVMLPLTREGKRVIQQVTLVVNPSDYWAKIFPATAQLTTSGTYVHGVLPINADIVQSVVCPVGKMIAGVAKDYEVMLGYKDKIEYSDDYKFLEDQRIYATKMTANGFPLGNDRFLVFDISGLTATNFAVETKGIY